MFHHLDTVTMGGIHAIGQNRNGLIWPAEKLNKLIVSEINLNVNFFTRKAKVMSDDFERAAKIINDSAAIFEAAIDHLTIKENALTEQSKKVSGNVRKAANDLFTGLTAIEKMANFDKLERYVLLLERTAIAMTTLSDLDKVGKLEKIFSVVKN